MLKELSLLAFAGAAGTLARFGVAGFVQRFCGERFPWGTLTVNAVGCFLFGFVWALAEERLLISGQTRFIVLTGFMGAFTTFSTFAFETSGLLRDSEWWLAIGNVAANNLLGVVFVLLGFAASRVV